MKSHEGKNRREKADEVQVSGKLISAAVEATIRVFISVFGLFLVGLLIDALRGQPAFFAIIGTFLGIILAVFLIWQQIKRMDSGDVKIGFLDKIFNDEFRGKNAKVSRKTDAPKSENSSRKAAKK